MFGSGPVRNHRPPELISKYIHIFIISKTGYAPMKKEDLKVAYKETGSSFRSRSFVKFYRLF